MIVPVDSQYWDSLPLEPDISSSELYNYEELYSLVVTINHIENIHARDIITPAEYHEVVTRLLSQYNKTVREALSFERTFGDLDKFALAYGINAPAGIKRIKIGIPATDEAVDLPGSLETGSLAAQASSKGLHHASGRSAKSVAEVAGHFITFCDGVHLKLRNKQELHPLLAELVTSLNRVTKQNFDGRGKLVSWLIKLNQLRAGEELTDDELAQCLADVEHAYESFLAILD